MVDSRGRVIQLNPIHVVSHALLQGRQAQTDAIIITETRVIFCFVSVVRPADAAVTNVITILFPKKPKRQCVAYQNTTKLAGGPLLTISHAHPQISLLRHRLTLT